ncbi:MAG: GNAT family N-acetyltransferase [Pseudomonadota bacterium]|nr:GNAT family N-acetyltransferase [Pseudomonadota bacterium]
MTVRLETERLILRSMEPGDAESYIALMAEPDIARFLTPDGKPQSRADAWRAFAMVLGHQQIRGFNFFTVIEKQSGAFVGRVGPWKPEGWPSLECGWGIARAHWGKGYAPEAAVAAVRWTFDRFPDLDRIISLIDPGNANSQAVARKIGEQKSAETFRLWDLTLDVWSADRGAWLQRFG